MRNLLSATRCLLSVQASGLTRLAIVCAVCTTSLFNLRSQDIHFSQFMAAPMHNSPALTGLFDGDYRVMANYRSQWGSVTVPYSTFGAAGDAILSKGLLDGDFVGAGIWLYSDKAGDIALSTNQAMLSFAYHKGLAYYVSHFLSVGGQIGLAQRGFDPSKVTLDNQFDGFGFNNNVAPNETFDKSRILFADASIGISWFYSPHERANAYAGAGLYHFNNPNQSFLNNVFPLRRRYTVFGGGKLPVGERLTIHPNFIFHKQGALNELVVGSYWRIGLNHVVNKRQTGIALGAASRLGDAIIFTSMLEYDAFNIGFSYDWNISKLTVASAGRGGPELSLSYVIETPNSKRLKFRGKPTGCAEF